MLTRVLWVRHGESEANAGLPTPDAWTTPLTPQGWEQARCVSGVLGRPDPAMIVQSCMLRAQQTARPTAERFPLAPVREWPVHEFTFLSGAAYANTTQAQRDEGVRRYWERMDPDYCDGRGAESFAQFIARVDDVLARLRRHAETGRAGDGPIVVFSHGRFIRGVLLRVGEFMHPGACGLPPGALGPIPCALGRPDEPMEVLMRRFHHLSTMVSVPNGVMWSMALGERPCRWVMGGAEIGHLIAA